LASSESAQKASSATWNWPLAMADFCSETSSWMLGRDADAPPLVDHVDTDRRKG
jgi:hypothetical protein